MRGPSNRLELPPRSGPSIVESGSMISIWLERRPFLVQLALPIGCPHSEAELKALPCLDMSRLRWPLNSIRASTRQVRKTQAAAMSAVVARGRASSVLEIAKTALHSFARLAPFQGVLPGFPQASVNRTLSYREHEI